MKVSCGTPCTNLLSAALRGCRSSYLAAGGLSLLINLLTLTVPLYMMQVYDRVLSSGSLDTLLHLTLVAVAALGLLSILDAVRGRALGRVGLWLEHALSPHALARALEAALSGDGNDSQAPRDLAALRTALGGAVTLALMDAPWVPVYLALIYVLHPVLGHTALAGVLLLVAAAALSDRATRSFSQCATAMVTDGLRQIENGVRNACVVDAMGMLPALVARSLAGRDERMAHQTIASDRAALLCALSRCVRQGVQVALLAAGAWLVVRHEVSGGTMMASSLVMGRALAPVEQAIASWRQVTQGHAAYRRLNSLFARPAKRFGRSRLPMMQGRLTVENLTCAVGGTTILRGVSFSLAPGEALAVVGPPAAGKSTLARLLVSGHRNPAAGTGGRVRIDGADIQDWSPIVRGEYLGYLPQEVGLFSGTVGENIARMAEPDPTLPVNAARRAGLHEIILRMPNGYDTAIGESGALLSIGLRQRVGLARAFYGNPRLIVLDEPDAYLDAEGEAALAHAIAGAKKDGAAVIIIGHRPRILEQTDRVMVLRNGFVELLGPRQAVLDRLAAHNVTALRPRPPVATAGIRSTGPWDAEGESA
ncbi:type I secretion system permease/ATPase [Azospirillum largimobile]